MARAKDLAQVMLEVDGVTYGVKVGKTDDGRDWFRFTSSNPPQGLDTIIYEFTGMLPRNGR